MQTIKRDIYVTKNVLQAPIEVTEGTNSIAIEFDVRDYEIPASAAAVAYSLSTSSMEEPNKALADVSGNKITIIPSEAFFLPGQNVMQVRIIDGNSKLISFNIIVKCTGKMRFGDEKEEQQSTLVEQMLAKLGEYQKKSASPYNFKGSCLSSELPASGNTINDTYYCTDLKYRKTWNGSAWEQSSLNEADYEDELTKTNGEVSSLKEDLVNLLDLTGYDFLNGYYMLNGEYNADIPESLFQCTDFILCPEGCTGKVINSVTDNIYIAGINYYDANKKFIGYELYNVGADAEYTFKAPKNALYMTINSKKSKNLTLIFIDNPLGLSVSMSANYKYNSFKGKQFAIYSDSYGDTTLPYHSWVDKISELTGKTVHNHSAAGATLTNIKDSFDDYADADYYIIAGGVNDWVNNSPLINTYNAVREMYNKIIAVNPNAKVFFTTPIRNLDYTKANLNRTIYFPVEFYRQAIWSSCRTYTKIRCISGLKFECDVNTDGLHPTPSTSVNIAYGILDGILENGNTRDFENVKHDVPSEGYFLIEGGKISFVFTDEIRYGANGFPGAYLRILDKVNTNHIEGDCFGYYTDEINGVFKPCKYTVTSQGIDFRCGDNVTVTNTNTPVRLELAYKGIIT